MAEFLSTSDPTDLSPDKYRSQYVEFLEDYEFVQLEMLLLTQCGPQEHISIAISFPDLIHYNSPLAFYTINYPQLLLPIFDEAAIITQKKIISHPGFKRKHSSTHQNRLQTLIGSIKQHCHVRIISLPSVHAYSKQSINDINSESISSLIQLSGTIVRTGGVRMLDLSKQYQCQNPKCKFTFTVCADPEQNYMLPQPKSCPRPPDFNLDPSQASNKAQAKMCNSTNLREIEGSRVCVDYQEIKLQDRIDRLTGIGAVPRSIVVILEANLVDEFNAGDEVVVVGTVQRQWRPVMKGARCVIDLAIKANSITSLHSSEKTKVSSDDSKSIFSTFWKNYEALPFTGRNIIIRSVCPQLFGLFYVKLCLLLTLVGGTNTSHSTKPATADTSPLPLQSGDDQLQLITNLASNKNTRNATNTVRRRYQSHLLIVGDPGCGKSQLLRFAAATIKRSVLTTGIGTTGAGLTCTIAKDGIDWVVEAGALVLANDGLCCIDEFASIREADRATIHEAMEQQTLSVAKAGLVVKLNTRATVIACCNPKGSYDVNLDISTNTAIASPLLSRFDIVLILLDTPNKEWDKQVSTFLLQQAVSKPRMGGHSLVNNNKTSNSNSNDCSSGSSSEVEDIEDRTRNSSSSNRNLGSIKSNRATDFLTGPWSLQLLSQYIAYVKHTFHPTMSNPAKQLLMRYYQMQRQSDDRSSARTSVRLLESLLRLSEAHAKIMSRHSVELCDAVVTIFCLSLSQTQSSILDGNETLQTGFPVDAEEHYKNQEIKVFQLLHTSREKFLREIGIDDAQCASSAAAINRANITDRSDVVDSEEFQPIDVSRDIIVLDEDAPDVSESFFPNDVIEPSSKTSSYSLANERTATVTATASDLPSSSIVSPLLDQNDSKWLLQSSSEVSADNIWDNIIPIPSTQEPRAMAVDEAMKKPWIESDCLSNKQEGHLWARSSFVMDKDDDW